MAAGTRSRRRGRTAAERRPVFPVRAENPYGAGVDLVQRVADGLDMLFRRGQIGQPAYDAGCRFRAAFERCQSAGLGSPLGHQGAAARRAGPAMPPEAALAAAARLREALALLGETDMAVVVLVAGQGHSITEAAAALYGAPGGRCRGQDVRMAGRRLREALELLARRWFGPETAARRMQVSRKDGAIPAMVAETASVPPANAATAGYAGGRFRVRRAGGPAQGRR